MKQRHVAAYRLDARETLKWCGVPLGANFYALDDTQVARLRECADRARYQPPRDVAKHSHLRHYHDMMQRRAK